MIDHDRAHRGLLVVCVGVLIVSAGCTGGQQTPTPDSDPYFEITEPSPAPTGPAGGDEVITYERFTSNDHAAIVTFSNAAYEPVSVGITIFVDGTVVLDRTIRTDSSYVLPLVPLDVGDDVRIVTSYQGNIEEFTYTVRSSETTYIDIEAHEEGIQFRT
ncbi:hypothetical protein [Halobaculum rubrum]|uniref:hypothetical protein n=1 Tax=Halobaculum rubrum TaxID=2872158 RepID=UPI001CA3E138|nr:hypothetical protein [Halobaculum rubrum]QZY01169.1 hypothetical protein K6T25_15380 [Halobaculum rubrum]